MMTPADELRAAAAKLRELADDLGEWRYDDGNTMIRDRNGDIVAANINQGDGAWIALLGPGKAEPLAAWLDAEAACQEAIAADVGSQTIARVLDAIAGRETGAELTTSYDVGPQALAFARSILEMPQEAA